MSGKQKPLPPQKGPQPVKSASPVIRPPVVVEHRSTSNSAPLIFEHRADFCPADSDLFNSMSRSWSLDGWELVSVVPHQKHVSTANGTGMSHGWMMFWKRIKKEATS